MRAGDVIRRVRTWITRDQLLPQELDVNEVVTDVERLLHSELIIRQVRVDAPSAAGPAAGISRSRSSCSRSSSTWR